jgi:predicted N-acetyltransferase YhbS
VLIRRETDRDTDVIRAITTAAFARGRPPGQIPPEARLIDELRAGPAWLPALSLWRSLPQAKQSATSLAPGATSASTL